jgi:hypothetical protein
LCGCVFIMCVYVSASVSAWVCMCLLLGVCIDRLCVSSRAFVRVREMERISVCVCVCVFAFS